MTADQLSKMWRISHDDAQRTLEVITQLNRQDADALLSWRLGTNDLMLCYKRINLLFYTDTFFSLKVARKRGLSMMQLHVNDNGFVKVYGMKSQTEFVNALRLFCNDVGASKAMIVDLH